MTDIDPRIVPIRTAPLWARRGLVIALAGPFLFWQALTSRNLDEDLDVLATFWRR